MNSHDQVLVTGGSGFIAGHRILLLLQAGYHVRTTIRSREKEAATRRVLEKAGMDQGQRLQFVVADLLDDRGWAAAMADIDFVLHVASPVEPGAVADEKRVITPAVEGTVRVMRAAHDARVRRIVLTSAFHAVSWGYPHDDHVFTEADWTILDGPGVDAYGKSKTLAERAAWDFIGREGGTLELTTMLPVAVVGPVLGRDVSGANHIIERMLGGKMPVVPRLFFPIVDVRDVASGHILAMTHPAAAGERFLLSNGAPLSLREIGAVIRAALGNTAANVPTRELPDLVVRLLALFKAEMRPFVHDLNYAKNTSNEKACRVLGWSPRDPREAIVAAALSLAERDASS
jgi:nucleoside-diphosphate-sugar epimerase